MLSVLFNLPLHFVTLLLKHRLHFFYLTLLGTNLPYYDDWDNGITDGHVRD